MYLWTHEDLHVIGWLDQLVLSTFKLGVALDWLKMVWGQRYKELHVRTQTFLLNAINKNKINLIKNVSKTKPNEIPLQI